MKIYVVGGDTYYARWIENAEITNNLKEADIVFFTGGEDVTPSYYGCKKHKTTYNNPQRDAYEKEIFDSIRRDQLVVSVCRGSQFCCVVNGGKLIQNCDNHALWGTHEIINKNGDVYDITSTHHQMAYLFDINPEYYDILYWTNPSRSTYYEGDGIDSSKIIKEPEVTLYHVPNKPVCIGIQGHPEMMSEGPVHTMLNNLIVDVILEYLC